MLARRIPGRREMVRTLAGLKTGMLGGAEAGAIVDAAISRAAPAAR